MEVKVTLDEGKNLRNSMADKSKKNIKVGQKVRIPWVEFDSESSWEIPDLIGAVDKVENETYHIKIENNPKYNILKLSSNEFQIIK